MDGATRIWLDDPNPIFRMGLAASLRDSRFVVVGESAGFVPPPTLDAVDVLVFDLGEQSAEWALARRHRRSTRLVGLVPGGDADGVGRSQCTVLARSDLTPEGFRHCLASVAAGASAPAAARRSDEAGRPESVGTARADAGRRLRRLMARKGPLFAVVVALAGGGGHLTADVEGLALVQQPGRRGFLLASSEGDSTFSIYRRGGEQAWLGRREVADGSAADGCTDTDGIEAVAANLGPDFPAGIFVYQDGSNTTPGPAGRQNFKYVRLETFLDVSSLPS